MTPRSKIVRKRSGKADLRLVFGSTLVILLLLVGLRIIVSFQPSKNSHRPVMEDSPSEPDMAIGVAATRPIEKVKKNPRPLVKSVGTFSFSVQVLKTSDLVLDMSDHGDELISNADAMYAEIQHRQGEKVLAKYTTSAGNKLVFTDTGTLKPRQGVNGDPNRETRQAYTLSDNRNVSTVFDDDSFLTVTDESVGRSPAFALKRQYKDSSPVIYYRSSMPICILERSEKNSFWFRVPKSIKSGDDDLLFHLHDGNAEAIEFPAQYKSVDRVCQTGDMIAASFGSPESSEPIRSFVMHGAKWTELPTPEGFDSSYVQKITFSGVILGYVENSSSGEKQPVAWKNQACKLLSSLPNWPTSSESQLIYKANRKGDLYLIQKTLPRNLTFRISIKDGNEKTGS